MSWDSLWNIIKQDRLERERLSAEKPVDCPRCATTLEESSRGLHCPFGDWTEN